MADIRIRVPGKKTIRRRLQRQRKRIGGLEIVYPNEQLASIVGPEPRPRREFARHFYVRVEELGLVDPSKRFVHASPAHIELFWGRSRIRVDDISRVVLYNLLPGDPTTDPPDPKPKIKFPIRKGHVIV